MGEVFKTVLMIILWGVIVGVVFVFVNGAFKYGSSVRECQDYNSYGYVAQVKGDYWTILTGREVCLIHMQDGTKLPLKDFRTTVIKTALIR